MGTNLVIVIKVVVGTGHGLAGLDLDIVRAK